MHPLTQFGVQSSSPEISILQGAHRASRAIPGKQSTPSPVPATGPPHLLRFGLGANYTDVHARNDARALSARVPVTSAPVPAGGRRDGWSWGWPQALGPSCSTERALRGAADQHSGTGSRLPPLLFLLLLPVCGRSWHPTVPRSHVPKVDFTPPSSSSSSNHRSPRRRSTPGIQLAGLALGTHGQHHLHHGSAEGTRSSPGMGEDG